MSYTNYFVADSSTRTGTLGENLKDGSCRAVMFNDEGNVVIATEPEKAVGLLITSTDDALFEGDTVTFLVKDSGLMAIGSQVKRGDFVTLDDQGRGVKAQSGDTIFGRAFTDGTLENSAVEVMVFPHGATLGG